MRKYFILFFIIGFTYWNCKGQPKFIKLESPTGIIKILISKNFHDINYKVFYDKKEVIRNSKLGIEFKNGNSLFNYSKIINKRDNYFDESWELPWGEVKTIRNHYNETILSFENENNDASFSLIFRAYDDGISFRYYVENHFNNKDSIIISDELTQFNLIEDADAWWTPAYGANRYEELYLNTKITEIDTAHTPLTIRYKNGVHISIHEASLVNYSSMQLFHSNDGKLNCDLAPWKNGDKVRTGLPFISPWRTIKIASSAKELLTSYLILNCNEPSKIEDLSWIKPAKYIGIWWGMILGKWTWGESFRHGATNERSFKYIDFASNHGFDEVLIEGWASGWKGLFPKDSVTISFTKATPDFNLRRVQNYAKSKGLSIQSYHETMGNTKNYLEQIDSAFYLLNQLGIKNVKIGHVGKRLDRKEFHYGQYGVDYFRTVLNKALEYKIGVNFHEPIKDTGERRTYPNMLTREGARGMEYNAWSGGNPPSHTTILPFTRLLNSPMDFTPGIFDLLYENIDSDIKIEYPVEFTIIDSGNGFHDLRYKSSESIWREKPMNLHISNEMVNIWKIKQNFQIGEWEWGVSASHAEIKNHDIWLPQILKQTENRKIYVNEEGQINGETKIIIPMQPLSIIKNKSSLNQGKTNDFPRVSSTIAKQLALYVVIYSPLQMASDFIENYKEHSAFQFIKDVPINWDSTVVINGEIGEYLTIARKDRKSKDWYIGSITNEVERFFSIDLSFLDEGIYEATIYADTKETNWEINPLEYKISKLKVSKDDKYSIKLAPGGGQAVKLRYLIE